MAECKSDATLAIVRTGFGDAPSSPATLPELTGKILTAEALVASPEVAPAARTIDREFTARCPAR